MKKRLCAYSGIGGQAVLEGVMMKSRDKYAVAVRKSDGNIAVEVEESAESAAKKRVKKIPFLRGIFVFIDSLTLGLRSVNMSAAYFDEEDSDKAGEGGASETALNAIVTVASFVIAIAVFMLLPYFLASLFKRFIDSDAVIAVLEGVMRIAVFVGYILLISMMEDIRRLFAYHGAEHKCINCIESGLPLTVENARGATRLHKRCGTSFMLFVMLVSVVLFFFIRADSLAMRLVLRIALIPVIAGVSYEFIRLAGQNDNIVVRIISAPGLWLQRITTREPEDEMIEVGIAAVEAVFDWRQYLSDAFGKTDAAGAARA